MPRKNSSIPKTTPIVLQKTDILNLLQAVDSNPEATKRILKMENGFREKIQTLSDNLPAENSTLGELTTNPFVLMAHCFHKKYTKISQIENDILIGKMFSFLETSLGRMIEEIVLPVYSWNVVPSQMQTPYSVIDGELRADSKMQFVTLKSGPRCINDSMVAGIANDIVQHYRFWADDKKVKYLDFTIGILYGTYKQSQKKDWHILDETRKKLADKGIKMTIPPDGIWSCSFQDADLIMNIDVKIGLDLWRYICRSDKALIEILVALVRACIPPSASAASEQSYTISNLKDIVSLNIVPKDYNVSVLQRGQLEWLFLLTSHFCDKLVPTTLDQT